MNNLLNLLAAGFDYLTGSDDSSDSRNPLRDSARQRQQNPVSPASASKDRDPGYTPSYADICIVRAMLKSLKLPTELVLEILAYAEYEPVIAFAGGSRAVLATAHMGAANSAKTCLRAGVLSADTIHRISGPKVTLRVKEINFDFTSRDQGWTSENTRGSYDTSSWLETSIFRPSSRDVSAKHLDNIDNYDGLNEVQDHLMTRGYGRLIDKPTGQTAIGAQDSEPPVAWYLQGNKVCERQNCDYQVTWASDYSEGNEGAGNGAGFLDALEEGDTIFVWARAKVSTLPVTQIIYSRRRAFSLTTLADYV